MGPGKCAFDAFSGPFFEYARWRSPNENLEHADLKKRYYTLLNYCKIQRKKCGPTGSLVPTGL